VANLSLGTSLSHTYLLPHMSALQLAKLVLWLRWQRPGSLPNTQTFPILTIFSRLLSRLWAPWILLRSPFSRIWATESARFQGIYRKRPIFSSALQSPYNALTPCCVKSQDFCCLVQPLQLFIFNFLIIIIIIIIINWNEQFDGCISVDSNYYCKSVVRLDFYCKSVVGLDIGIAYDFADVLKWKAHS